LCLSAISWVRVGGVHEGYIKASLDNRKASVAIYDEMVSNAGNVDTSLGKLEHKVRIDQTNQKKTRNDLLEDLAMNVQCNGSPLYKLGSRAKMWQANAAKKKRRKRCYSETRSSAYSSHYLQTQCNPINVLITS